MRKKERTWELLKGFQLTRNWFTWKRVAPPHFSQSPKELDHQNVLTSLHQWRTYDTSLKTYDSRWDLYWINVRYSLYSLRCSKLKTYSSGIREPSLERDFETKDHCSDTVRNLSVRSMYKCLFFPLFLFNTCTSKSQTAIYFTIAGIHCTFLLLFELRYCTLNGNSMGKNLDLNKYCIILLNNWIGLLGCISR